MDEENLSDLATTLSIFLGRTDSLDSNMSTMEFLRGFNLHSQDVITLNILLEKITPPPED